MTLLVPSRASLAPSAPGLCPTAGWEGQHFWARCWTVALRAGFRCKSELQQGSEGFTAAWSSFVPSSPTSCWLCCSFMSPAQYQMGMLLVQVHKRPKGTLPFWARAADNTSFWKMPALVSFNSFEVFGFFKQFPYRFLTDNPIVALLKQTLLAVWL